jgi:nucleoside-diphosphate-sugar epimerase
MKVFVTGATGNIGSAVVTELLSAGHSVLGLTRSTAGADKLKAAGAESLLGTLADLDLLKKAASECDAVAHLAFNHNFDDYLGACATDRAAITAMASALAAADGGAGKKALVMTSGTMMLEKGRVVAEHDSIDTTSPFSAARGASEGVALGFGEQGVRAMVMRLPPVVHGAGSFGFLAILLQAAKRDGCVSYVGKGENRWGTVHTLDAARAYRLALENGQPGAVYHAVAEEAVLVKDVSDAVGASLKLSVASKTPEEAQKVFGMMAMAITADNPSSSDKTKKALGWTPTQKGLVSDIKEGLLEQFTG